MTRIYVDISGVRESSSYLKTSNRKVSQIYNQLSSINSSLDSRIRQRHNIAGQINRISSHISTLEGKLENLDDVVKNAMIIYETAEKNIAEKYNELVEGKQFKESAKEKETLWEKMVNPAIALKKAFDESTLYLKSGLAVGLMATSGIQFKRGSGKNITIIKTADWVKGQGKNQFIKSKIKSINNWMKNQSSSKLSQFIKKQFKFGKYQTFTKWYKEELLGIKKSVTRISTSKLPKLMAGKLFKIDLAFATVEEVSGLYSDYKKSGNVDGFEVADATVKVGISAGSSYVGAVLLGSAGALLGPGGAAAGVYIGGVAGNYLGSKLGDWIDDSNIIKKSCEWAKNLFR